MLPSRRLAPTAAASARVGMTLKRGRKAWLRLDADLEIPAKAFTAQPEHERRS